MATLLTEMFTPTSPTTTTPTTYSTTYSTYSTYYYYYNYSTNSTYYTTSTITTTTPRTTAITTTTSTTTAPTTPTPITNTSTTSTSTTTTTAAVWTTDAVSLMALFYGCCTGCLCSPNYPSNYDNNLNNEYIITSGGGPASTVTITFLLFSLEKADTDSSSTTTTRSRSTNSCVWDYIEIYDGTGSGSSATGALLLNRTCGSTAIPGPVTSTSSTATLLFVSDGAVTSVGFVAKLSGGATFSLTEITINQAF